MSPQLIGEFVGTALLVLLGDAVVANVCLAKTKGGNGGWNAIAWGWAMAVLIPALIFGRMSGAHFNPALTIGLALGGFTDAVFTGWAMVPGYIGAQLAGAFVGAIVVWIMYKDHFDATEDAATKLGVFSTIPAIRNIPMNLFSEVVGTFFLVFAILGIGQSAYGDVGALKTFGVGGIILAAGMSLGGTTGYAINPARDLGPRIAHAILPIKGKGGSDWGYAGVPILGPIVGACLAALAAGAIF